MELIQKRQAILDRTAHEAENREEDAVLQGKIVEIVFNNAQSTIESMRERTRPSYSSALRLDNPKFLCAFVVILYQFSQFPFVEPLVEQIYRV